MKLTTFTDYSLRVLLYLTARPERRATIAEIAQAFDVSEHHLTKVVHFLGRHGWLATVRGKGGGLGLAAAPSDIVVGRVVRATEGEARPAECFGAAPVHCRIERVCRLRGVLADAVQAFYGVLDGVTLADLVDDRAALAPLLFVPEARHSA